MRTAEFSQASFTPRYREQGPTEIALPDAAKREAIEQAWSNFFASGAPMEGVHLGILVQNMIELSGGMKGSDGVSEKIFPDPGGDGETLILQHRPNDKVPGGDAAIILSSRQGHGKTVESIVWGRDLTGEGSGSLVDKATGRRVPSIRRIHQLEGSKFVSLVTAHTGEASLTPQATINERPIPYNIGTDGKAFLGRTFQLVRGHR